MAKRKTGLGVNALFGTTDSGPQSDDANEGARQRLPQVRTSILFYEDDFRILENLKVQLRRTFGRSISQSEIVREALRRYAEQEGIA